MKLFHAFPRPSHTKDVAGAAIRSKPTGEDRANGLKILELMLRNGLLCTPETFKLYPNYNTTNVEKKVFLDPLTHHDKVVQSRACFTLLDTLELAKEYEVSGGGEQRYASHADLFGEFAIGLDPIEARELGIMPTVYYYRQDIENSRLAGLGSQIIERLDEMRNLFSVISQIEAKAHKGKEVPGLPTISELEEMGVQVRHQKDIKAGLDNLSEADATFFFRILNTDRVPACNLADFVEIMLSLYQTTDSTIEKAPLAFFNQKEWRLVHHMMAGLVWYGMGDHPSMRDPLAEFFGDQREEIDHFIRKNFSNRSEGKVKGPSWFLNNSWVLSGREEKHFRDFVREIIVPKGYEKAAQSIVDSLYHGNTRPEIKTLPKRWRIVTENDIPRIQILE